MARDILRDSVDSTSNYHSELKTEEGPVKGAWECSATELRNLIDRDGAYFKAFGENEAWKIIFLGQFKKSSLKLSTALIGYAA